MAKASRHTAQPGDILLAVMYLGRIVELADAATLFKAPAHPYMQALLSAILPHHRRARRNRLKLKGDVLRPLAIPKGCRFAPRLSPNSGATS